MPRKGDSTVTMNDGSWYLDKFSKHECCDCALVHDVQWKVENGRLFTKWSRNERETKQVRRKHKIKVSRSD